MPSKQSIRWLKKISYHSHGRKQIPIAEVNAKDTAITKMDAKERSITQIDAKEISIIEMKAKDTAITKTDAKVRAITHICQGTNHDSNAYQRKDITQMNATDTDTSKMDTNNTANSQDIKYTDG